MSGRFFGLCVTLPLQLQNRAHITLLLLAGSLWRTLPFVCRDGEVAMTGPSLCVLLVSSWTQKSVTLITLKGTTHVKSCLWWWQCYQRVNQVETLTFDLLLSSLTFLLKQLPGYTPICCLLSATAVCCSQMPVEGRSTIYSQRERKRKYSWRTNRTPGHFPVN